jgi:hypothetical protein
VIIFDIVRAKRAHVTPFSKDTIFLCHIRPDEGGSKATVLRRDDAGSSEATARIPLNHVKNCIGYKQTVNDSINEQII